VALEGQVATGGGCSAGNGAPQAAATGRSGWRLARPQARCYKSPALPAPRQPVEGGLLPLLHIAVLAAVQGITEFLPISSSGHLILVPAVAGWPDQGVTIDIAVHVGTLGAVMAYLWRDIWEILLGFRQLARKRLSPGMGLFGIIVVGTIPVVIAGYLLHETRGGPPRSVEIIAWTTLGFGILLFVVDRLFMTVRRVEHMGAFHALVIGLFQVLALIPGTSRSGITMTAGRMLGYERAESARFSMLLSIPTIMGAGVLAGLDLYEAGDVALNRDAVLAAGLAFVFAFFAIAAMMSWLRRATFTPFVIYRVILGAALLCWIYGVFDTVPWIPPPPAG